MGRRERGTRDRHRQGEEGEEGREKGKKGERGGDRQRDRHIYMYRR